MLHNIHLEIEMIDFNLISLKFFKLQERKQINNVIENTKLGHQELKKVILEKEIHLKGMEETTQKMDKQLEEGKLRKIQVYVRK